MIKAILTLILLLPLLGCDSGTYVIVNGGLDSWENYEDRDLCDISSNGFGWVDTMHFLTDDSFRLCVYNKATLSSLAPLYDVLVYYNDGIHIILPKELENKTWIQGKAGSHYYYVRSLHQSNMTEDELHEAIKNGLSPIDIVEMEKK